MELVYRGREIAFEEVCGIFLDPLPVEQLKKSIQEYELMKQDEANKMLEAEKRNRPRSR